MDTIKNRIILIMGAVVMVLALACAFGYDTIQKGKADRKRLSDNCTVLNQRITFNDSISGMQTQAFRLKLDQLKSNQEGERNGYSQTVSHLKQLLADANIRLKDFETGVQATITTTDTTVGQLVEKPDVPKPIPKDTCTYIFFTRFDSTVVHISGRNATKISKYTINPTLLVVSTAKKNSRNKPHWILPRARWLWGSQRSYILTTDNPKATVTDLTVIERQE